MNRDILKKTVRDFLDDDCPMMAAALSYYTVFSLPPLFILIMTIIGVFMSPERVQEALSSQLGSVMGTSAQEAVVTIFEQAERPHFNRGVMSVV